MAGVLDDPDGHVLEGAVDRHRVIGEKGRDVEARSTIVRERRGGVERVEAGGRGDEDLGPGRAERSEDHVFCRVCPVNENALEPALCELLVVLRQQSAAQRLDMVGRSIADVSRDVGEHETGQPLGMHSGVRRDDGAAVAVPDEHEARESERLGDGRDILREPFDRVIAIFGDLGFAHAAQIERHRPPARAQMTQLPGPLRAISPVAMNEDDRNPSAPAVIHAQTPLPPPNPLPAASAHSGIQYRPPATPNHRDQNNPRQNPLDIHPHSPPET